MENYSIVISYYQLFLILLILPILLALNTVVVLLQSTLCFTFLGLVIPSLLEPDEMDKEHIRAEQNPPDARQRYKEDSPSIERAIKFLTVFGHSLPHNSISISPAVVTTITLALVAGYSLVLSMYSSGYIPL